MFNTISILNIIEYYNLNNLIELVLMMYDNDLQMTNDTCGINKLVQIRPLSINPSLVICGNYILSTQVYGEILSKINQIYICKSMYLFPITNLCKSIRYKDKILELINKQHRTIDVTTTCYNAYEDKLIIQNKQVTSLHIECMEFYIYCLNNSIPINITDWYYLKHIILRRFNKYHVSPRFAYLNLVYRNYLND